MANNPYQATSTRVGASTPIVGRMRSIGTIILVAGLALLSYGATAFWLVNSLPPNGGDSGRLPSLYVMGLGIFIAVVGLATRDLQSRSNKANSQGERSIPTRYGILGLVAIIALLILTISQL